MSGGSFSRAGFHVGDQWRVDCYTFDNSTPIFDISAGTSSVVISIRDRNPDENAVKFARALAREAQKFAAAIERMHAAPADGGIKAAGSDAA
ncbi:MAG: hypothetical protein ACRDNW_04700 [Trebonia sp.]